MGDPREGVAPDGTIRTGAARERVPPPFEPVLQEAAAAAERYPGASLYLYGSVANGTARPGSSDIDLLSIDLLPARELGDALSRRFADLCRGVEVAPARAADFCGPDDAAYGNRVFLRHYCVHLTGPDPARELPPYAADARAARGFNGDLGHQVDRWRAGPATVPAAELGVRVARKTLLAVAGMVSVHDGTWTTDRSTAARRWAQVEPALAPGLRLLDRWARGVRTPTADEVTDVLDDRGVVSVVLAHFSEIVGLWSERPSPAPDP